MSSSDPADRPPDEGPMDTDAPPASPKDRPADAAAESTQACDLDDVELNDDSLLGSLSAAEVNFLLENQATMGVDADSVLSEPIVMDVALTPPVEVEEGPPESEESPPLPSVAGLFFVQLEQQPAAMAPTPSTSAAADRRARAPQNDIFPNPAFSYAAVLKRVASEAASSSASREVRPVWEPIALRDAARRLTWLRRNSLNSLS
ncbi:hypothetical protein Q1695_002694 [Nippostrongylus brasiliensis]|nr:hypothetical protein Q1695_002694 [Nippostrongylus brasiliensis]